MTNTFRDEFIDIEKQLQKSLEIVKKSVDILKDQENISRKTIQSVANLTEQLLSCLKVNHLELPLLTEFPDVSDRLVDKLTREITDDLQQLKLIVNKLTDCCDGLTRQYDQCLLKFNKHNNQDNLPFLARQTATCPPLSEMMEMVEWIDSRLRESCLCKKYIIEEFDPEKFDDTASLEKAWFEGDAEMLKQIQDYLALTIYFCEEKIS